MSQQIDNLILHLGGNFVKALTNRYVALKHLIECLHQKRCPLQFLDLSNSGFTEQQMYHLVLLLIHSYSLEVLSLDGNILSSGFSFFCLALRMNKCLATLSLNSLHLSDDDVLLLADALHEHANLSALSVALTNPFQPSIFTQFLRKVFESSSKSCLSEISVLDYQYSPMQQQLETYQVNRQQEGIPQINLTIFNVQEVLSNPARTEQLATGNLLNHPDLLTGKH